MMKRLFVAVDLPAEMKAQIGSICHGLPDTRWIPPEQIHLTVRFIGEVEGSIFKQIASALAGIVCDPPMLEIKGIGHFPPRRKPRVLWLGVEPNDLLLRLRNRIEAILVKSGLPPEGRKFAPHITIARLKNPPINRVADFMAAHSLFALPPFPVEEFHLYSSILSSSGAVHRIEETYPLI
ncbi:MAG: RNA 2',3'-cyclic phosphodiesterase [Thermodesulfobacteriota bacterium]